MSKLGRNRSKNLERWVAKEFGGRRIGILGKEDVELRQFSFECKEREKGFPRFLKDSMEQANANAPIEKIPAVYLHENNRPHDEDLLIFYAEDIKAIIQAVEEGGLKNAKL
jgi:hypothetical protein